jgi:hypothetical protein
MAKITICDYIASQNPEQALALLEESGVSFERPRNKEDLAYILKVWVQREREEALKKLAAIHPDKDLLAEVSGYSNLDGANQMFGEEYANPFNRRPYQVGAPNVMLAANGCGCGAASFNGMNASGCKCGGKCGCGGNCQSNFSGQDKNNTAIIGLIGIIALTFIVIRISQ